MEKIAFQVGGDGLIQALTKENLLAVLVTSPVAVKLAESNKLIVAINAFNKGK